MNEEVATVKVVGSANIVQSIVDELTYTFRVLTNSGLIKNDRDEGQHCYLTLIPKEAG
jgi:hypothetical protein